MIIFFQSALININQCAKNKGVRKWLLVFAAAAIIVSLELFARYGIGLGTPPLSVEHPTIEYLFKPDQDVYRFGNHFIVNHYGMRSRNFPVHKSNLVEYRVMVFGDSVVNGGNLTDHTNLATTMLETRLFDRLKRPVIVGNISAGSWGPGNWLAYAREYRFFDADCVVLVISSHDAEDNPTFEPLNPNTHPTEKPILAVSEAISRYLPRYLPAVIRNAFYHSQPGRQNLTRYNPNGMKKGLQDLEAFLTLAQRHVPNIRVIQHWELKEIQKHQPDSGHDEISALCRKLGVVVMDMGDNFASALKEGKTPYRDNIHPNETGQVLLADMIENAIAE